LGISAKAKNGSQRSLSYLYWGWIRYVAADEGLTLPQSGTETDFFSEDQAKSLASVLKARAEKIRKGLAPRDASSFVQQSDKQWFPTMAEGEDIGTVDADFDDPDSMDETANFFDLSGGVTLKY
jgi:hypothetical protein